MRRYLENIFSLTGQLVQVATGHSAPVKDVKWVTTGLCPNKKIRKDEVKHVLHLAQP